MMDKSKEAIQEKDKEIKKSQSKYAKVINSLKGKNKIMKKQ